MRTPHVDPVSRLEEVAAHLWRSGPEHPVVKERLEQTLTLLMRATAAAGGPIRVPVPETFRGELVVTVARGRRRPLRVRIAIDAPRRRRHMGGVVPRLKNDPPPSMSLSASPCPVRR